MRLAERLGGTIVNADSMQVYRDLRVLTARPGAADEAAFPHRLYGHVDGAAAYSVARWLGEAADALRVSPPVPPSIPVQAPSASAQAVAISVRVRIVPPSAPT